MRFCLTRLAARPCGARPGDRDSEVLPGIQRPVFAYAHAIRADRLHDDRLQEMGERLTTLMTSQALEGEAPPAIA